MPTKVEMREYVIVNRNGADRYYWTPGVGDCIAVAAWSDNHILFAHLNSHQYLIPMKNGDMHTTATTKIRDFILGVDSGNVIWATNYKHDPGNLYSVKLKLGLSTAQLRIAGTDGYVDITLDTETLKLYRGNPQSVNNQSDLSSNRFDYVEDRTGNNNVHVTNNSLCNIF
jgi:hypothetical protein